MSSQLLVLDDSFPSKMGEVDRLSVLSRNLKSLCELTSSFRSSIDNFGVECTTLDRNSECGKDFQKNPLNSNSLSHNISGEEKQTAKLTSIFQRSLERTFTLSERANRFNPLKKNISRREISEVYASLFQRSMNMLSETDRQCTIESGDLIDNRYFLESAFIKVQEISKDNGKHNNEDETLKILQQNQNSSEQEVNMCDDLSRKIAENGFARADDAAQYISLSADSATPPIISSGKSQICGPKKKKRTFISRETREFLETAFELKRAPNSKERRIIAEKSGLTPVQVRVWFTNKRMRSK